jgi:amino acid transporter
MANAAPAVSVGLTLAALAAASAYASGPVILLCATPMLVIANAYWRLNLWTPNCGATFEWVGRAINPYLGLFAGGLMIAGNVAGTSAGIAVLAPSILAVFGTNAASTWPNIVIATAVILIMLVIAVVGIRLTARTQLGMGLIEYAILIGFAIAGLAAVTGHHPGTIPVTKGWFSLTGTGGKGDLAAGLLIAVFMYTGWDATVYVNEEVRGRRPNPGLSAVLAVTFLTVIFVVAEMGLQGVVSPARLQANASAALVYVAAALGGSRGAQVMALSLALSVIATTGTGIVILTVGLVFVAIIWVSLLSSPVANVFTDLINITGVLYASFYGLTALSAIVYYRRRVFSDAFDAVVIGILPFAAAGFLAWIMAKTLQAAPAAQLWTLGGVATTGVLVMLIARFVLRSSFFQIPRETAARES